MKLDTIDCENERFIFAVFLCMILKKREEETRLQQHIYRNVAISPRPNTRDGSFCITASQH